MFSLALLTSECGFPATFESSDGSTGVDVMCFIDEGFQNLVMEAELPLRIAQSQAPGYTARDAANRLGVSEDYVHSVERHANRSGISSTFSRPDLRVLRYQPLLNLGKCSHEEFDGWSVTFRNGGALRLSMDQMDFEANRDLEEFAKALEWAGVVAEVYPKSSYETLINSFEVLWANSQSPERLLCGSFTFAFPSMHEGLTSKSTSLLLHRAGAGRMAAALSGDYVYTMSRNQYQALNAAAKGFDDADVKDALKRMNELQPSLDSSILEHFDATLRQATATPQGVMQEKLSVDIDGTKLAFKDLVLAPDEKSGNCLFMLQVSYEANFDSVALKNSASDFKDDIARVQRLSSTVKRKLMLLITASSKPEHTAEQQDFIKALSDSLHPVGCSRGSIQCIFIVSGFFAVAFAVGFPMAVDYLQGRTAEGFLDVVGRVGLPVLVGAGYGAGVGAGVSAVGAAAAASAAETAAVGAAAVGATAATAEAAAVGAAAAAGPPGWLIGLGVGAAVGGVLALVSVYRSCQQQAAAEQRRRVTEAEQEERLQLRRAVIREANQIRAHMERVEPAPQPNVQAELVDAVVPADPVQANPQEQLEELEADEQRVHGRALSQVLMDVRRRLATRDRPLEQVLDADVRAELRQMEDSEMQAIGRIAWAVPERRQVLQHYLKLEYFGLFLRLDADNIREKAREQRVNFGEFGWLSRRGQARDCLCSVGIEMFQIGNTHDITHATISRAHGTLGPMIRRRPRYFMLIDRLGPDFRHLQEFAEASLAALDFLQQRCEDPARPGQGLLNALVQEAANEMGRQGARALIGIALPTAGRWMLGGI